MAWAPAVNLVLPGGGLILAGAIASGVVLGLTFAVAGNLALVAVLLFPDDFSALGRGLCMAVAGVVYVVAQVRLRGAVREERQRVLQRDRAAALRRVVACVEQDDWVGAVAAIRSIEHLAGTDLAIAYRLAFVLSQAGQVPEALAAWRQVRALDRHGVYRAERREFERWLERAGVP